MNTAKEECTKNEFYTTGERLNHILDKIGFKHGRGRVTEFHSYLKEYEVEVFNDLKYTTVRSWFQDHTPKMKKIDVIFIALQKNYEFNHDISQIKTWWKLGGYYPFEEKLDFEELGEKIFSENELDKKLQFKVITLVTEESGNAFSDLSYEDLMKLKDKALQFAQDYRNPFKADCPEEYLRLLIQEELRSLIDVKK